MLSSFSARIDQRAILLCEKCCHWLQRETGWTNYAVAQTCIIALSVLSICSPFFTDDTGVLLVWTITFSTFASVYLFWLATMVKAREADAFARIARGTANPFKHDPRFSGYRTGYLLVGVPTAIFLSLVDINGYTLLRTILSLFLILSTITMYALTCDPLPPCIGRCREKFRTLFSTVRSAGADVAKHAVSRS